MKMTNKQLLISLVIPVRNESKSLTELANSIKEQTFPLAEIVLVDGGSTDETVEVAQEIINSDRRFRIIEAGEATPGRGRNVGINAATNEWIALTDAGIRLEKNWLEKLVEEVEKNPEIDIVYGNVTPLANTFFEKCASISYAPSLKKGTIRGKFIASSLLKKNVWEAVGGFPDLRAAEDLMFMEAAKKEGFKYVLAPDAIVYWQLRPDLFSTFQKFILYSKHNARIGRQWDWHYGILKQYLILAPFLLLTIFHSWWWLTIVVLWLFARTTKRILSHRYEFGWQALFNPLVFGGVAFLVLVIDVATFIGWGQAIIQGKGKNTHESNVI